MPMSRHFSRWFIATTATFLLLAACQGDTTSPSESSDGGGARLAGETPAGTPGDTARGTPGTPTPSPAGDSSHTPPPPSPPPSAIQLSVYVGVATPGPDTLHTTPAANARVSVFSRTYTRSTGPDTITATEKLVASSSTDALGKVSFDNLPAVGYRLEAVVEGRPAASIQIAPPYSATFVTWIIFRPTP